MEASKALLSLWQACGLNFYQLRAKSLSSKEYLKWAGALKQAHPELHIIANDRATEALRHQDYFSGLHLGQEDLLRLQENIVQELVRRSLEAHVQANTKQKNKAPLRFFLGLSTHNSVQIQKALGASACRESSKGQAFEQWQPAKESCKSSIPWDYIALGPCFHTSSKKKAQGALKSAALQKALEVFFSLRGKMKPPPALVLIGAIRSSRMAVLQKMIETSFARAASNEMPPIYVAAIQAAKEGLEEIKALRRPLGARESLACLC